MNTKINEQIISELFSIFKKEKNSSVEKSYTSYLIRKS